MDVDVVLCNYDLLRSMPYLQRRQQLANMVCPDKATDDQSGWCGGDRVGGLGCVCLVLLMEEILHLKQIVHSQLFTRFHTSQVVQDFFHQQ